MDILNPNITLSKTGILQKRILQDQYEEENQEVEIPGDREHRTLPDENLEVTFKTHLDATKLLRKFVFVAQSMYRKFVTHPKLTFSLF